MVDTPILGCCHGQQQVDGLRARHQSKDLEVNAFALDKATGDEPSLVLENGATLIPLHLVDPLQPNQLATRLLGLVISMAFISSNIAWRQLASRLATANIGDSKALTRRDFGLSSSQHAKPGAPASPTMLSMRQNRTSSPSSKVSTNSLCQRVELQIPVVSPELPS